MTAEKEKKKRPFFLFAKGDRKKCVSGRTGPVSKIDPKIIRLLLLLATSAVMVFLVFPMPESYNISYQVGDIAGQDVKADRELLVMDRLATREKRTAAAKSAPGVFDLDDKAANVAAELVNSIFSRGRAILNAPPVDRPIYEDQESVSGYDSRELAELKDLFNSAFNLGPESGAFEAMFKAGFSAEAEKTLVRLVSDLLTQGVASDKNLILNHSDNGILVHRIYADTEEIAPYVGVFPSLEEARWLVRERALLYTADFPPDQIKAIVDMAQSLLRANLTYNEKESAKRRSELSEAVTPVFFKVKPGEMIVREGERIDPLDRIKLETMAEKVNRQDWVVRALGYFWLTAFFLGVTGIVTRRFCPGVRLDLRDQAFLCLLLLTTMLMAFSASQVGAAMDKDWPHVTRTTIFFLTPLAAGPMTATIFLGPMAGVFFSIISAALSALIIGQDLSVFFYCFIGAVVGMTGLAQVRERGAVIKSGLLVGLANMAVIVGLGFIEQSWLHQSSVYDLAAGFTSGILAGVVVTGLVPLFEMIFTYTTNIKLLELANLDRPILRELMLQAPGTYHHSVIVGAMVEAAAEAIGANPLLAKVSAYYHDLGKMKKPLYFIENQGAGENRHEKLAPSMSALILISHVKDGVELARKNKLTPEIIDIIRQHHGTSLISFFYQKARNSRLSDQPEININDYRYPGPRPQTREAGLVMLADAVEAASRTLTEPTPSRIQGMVQKLTNNIFSDGQLDECELTLKDLHLIAKSFNKILAGIFHRRVEYPESAAKEGAGRAKAANGTQPKQPAKSAPGQDRQDKSQRKEDLKRLGIS